MPAVVGSSAAGIGFMLVFLRALLREPKREGPRGALLVQLAEASTTAAAPARLSA